MDILKHCMDIRNCRVLAFPFVSLLVFANLLFQAVSLLSFFLIKIIMDNLIISSLFHSMQLEIMKGTHIR